MGCAACMLLCLFAPKNFCINGCQNLLVRVCCATMRVGSVGHFKPCTADICLQIFRGACRIICTHTQPYVHPSPLPSLFEKFVVIDWTMLSLPRKYPVNGFGRNDSVECGSAAAVFDGARTCRAGNAQYSADDGVTLRPGRGNAFLRFACTRRHLVARTHTLCALSPWASQAVLYLALYSCTATLLEYPFTCLTQEADGCRRCAIWRPVALCRRCSGCSRYLCGRSQTVVVWRSCVAWL